MKRTVERGSKWQLVSDNPDKTLWPDVAWPDDAEVVGQVCWVGRTLMQQATPSDSEDPCTNSVHW